MTIRLKSSWTLLLGLAAVLPLGCNPAPTDDDDSTPPESEDIICHGDALADNIPLSDDLDALRSRWDVNKELLRILFVGEPL
jgi:hypothetical protein